MEEIAPFLLPLTALQRLLARFEDRGMVIGGVAASLLGKPRLPTPEDLIIQKAVAHRPKDLLDIQAIIERHPELDRERIRYWVCEFAKLLEMPELWEDIAAWL